MTLPAISDEHARMRTHSLLAMAVVLAATQADAKVDPAAKCLSTRLIAAGKTARSLVGCQATAAKKGQPVDARCIEKAQASFAKKHAKADKRGGCTPVCVPYSRCTPLPPLAPPSFSTQRFSSGVGTQIPADAHTSWTRSSTT